MKTYTQIQKEVGEWNVKNFGNQETPYLKAVHHRGGPVQVGLVIELGSLAPLMGMVEEMGELHEAQTKADREDAIGDIAIYLCDYCHREGVPFPHRAANPDDGLACDIGIVAYLGRLFHCHLKRHQGIRGMQDDEVFWVARAAVLDAFVWHLEGYTSLVTPTNLITILNDTWHRVVKKRDWVADPNDGGGHNHTETE